MNKIGWFGTITSVIGSFTVALHFMLAGYVFFLAGSISWLFVAIIRRDKSLAVLNGFFLAANILGAYNAF
jgi:hypothetical protein